MDEQQLILSEAAVLIIGELLSKNYFNNTFRYIVKS